MPRSVTAILVAADGAEHLRETLDAITMQSRLPDRLVVVQLGADLDTGAVIEQVEPTAHAHVHARSGFGHAVEVGVKAAGVVATDEDWLWLLASDTAPEPRALERLLQSVEASPSVAVAGPKQMQWDAPDYLHSFGETLTPWGEAVEMAEPELDQAQYDRHSDVLGVAAGGMLVRAVVWQRLGGFDPALPAVDDALDFCVRARLAGNRVQLVPRARVRSAGTGASGTRLLGSTTSVARRARLRREAQLHRRLAYAPLPAVPLHWLSILPLGVVRALGQILRKQPGAAPAELLAAVVVLGTCFAPVARARSRIARNRRAGWSALAPLRQPWREVRHRRALARDNGRSPDRVEPVRFVSGGGLATTVALAAVALILSEPLLGAPALTGGTLLPLGDVQDLWRSIGWGVRALGEPFSGPADPFALVVALLGTLTFWHPSAAVVGLWVLAVPIAGAGGWLVAARATRRAPLRVLGGLLWAVAPTLLVALDAGRIGGVLVHLAAPFALLAALRARRSWTASATLALLTALMAACAPSLLPLLVVGWVAVLVAALAGRSRGLARLLPLPLPTAVLFLPLAAEQARHGRLLGVLADPGPVAAAPLEPHLLGLGPQLTEALQLAAGWPAWRPETWSALTSPLGTGADAAVLFAWALALPIALVALVGLFWPGRVLPVRVVVAGAAGLLTAALATRLQVVPNGAAAVPAWPGAGLSIAWLAVLEASTVGLDRLAAAGVLPFASRTRRGVRAGVAALVGATAVLALLAAGAPLLLGHLAATSVVRAGSTATSPALVAAEAATTPGLGLLTLTPQADGGFRQELVRGRGALLERTSTLQSTAGLGGSAGLDRLSAALVQPSGDDVAAALNTHRIGYVLLGPAADAGAGAARVEALSALGANPLLSAVSSTPSGALFRFAGLRPTATTTAEPDDTGTPIGMLVLLAQALVLGLTALLALPTSAITTRFRPVAAIAPPSADVTATARAAARSGSAASTAALPARLPAPPVREEVGAWR